MLHLLSVPRRGRILFVIAPLVALGLLGTACGSSPAASKNASSSSSTSTTTNRPAATSTGTSGATGSASAAAFTACLKSHGVTLPAGRPSATSGSRANFSRPTGATGARGFGGAFNSPTFQKALAACAKYRPQGAGFGFGGGGFNSPALAAYRNCLQLHGVTLPSGPTGPSGFTGTSGFSGPRGGGLGRLDTSNPTVKAAMAACASLRPSSPTGAPGSGAQSPSASS